MGADFGDLEPKFVFSDCFGCGPQCGYHFLGGNVLDSSISPHCRDWSVVVGSGVASYSLHYFIPDFYGTHEGVIRAYLGYGVVPLIFCLELEGNCRAIQKFALCVAVFKEGAIFEESDVS